MKKTIILLCCLTIGVTFYALQRSEAQTHNQLPNEKKLPAEDSKPISVEGKSGNTGDLTSKTAKSEAEIRRRNLPFSRSYKNIKPSPEKTIKLPVLVESEKQQPSHEKRLRIGTVREFAKPVTKISDGSFFSIVEGDVWLLEIKSEDALQLRLHFSKVNLPHGAKIFVYPSEIPEEAYLYEKTAVTDKSDFWTPTFDGDSIIIEYFTPNRFAAGEDFLPFQISQIGHVFKDPSVSGENSFSDPPDQPCHLNVPSNLTDLAKSVGHLRFVDDGFIYVCTGTLLNNLAGDLEPLLLTANHCINSQSAAQSLEVYWNYNSGDSPFSPAIRSREAVLLSTNNSSDFTLVRILGALPIRANLVLWSGWTTTDPPIGTNVFALHHPNGSYKRYASGSTISFCTSDFPCQNSIGVRYSQGTTEGGSSGSGLWNTNLGQLTGTLSGGEVGCGIRDSFGKFSVTYSFISPFMQGGSEDNLEGGNGNDNRENAALIQANTYNNLIIKWQDEDWYRISLPNNGTLNVSVNFTHVYGDIDLNLFRGSETTPVATSSSGSNTETISYTNSSGTTQSLSLRVFLFDGVRNSYNMTVSAPPAPSVTNKMFDFDGDGRSDISVFRPSNGSWFVLQSSNNSLFGLGFGLGSDVITPADYDGDGKTDIAVFRPSNGTWYFQQSTNGFSAVQFGQNGDIPQAADFDGDAKADLAIFRQSTGVWFLLRSRDGFTGVQFGQNGDKPVAADYDGDGRADIAVVRQENGASIWYISGSSQGFYGVQFGIDTDKIVPADYDGDDKTDIAVYRSGIWYLLRSQLGFTAVSFGTAEDKPVAADYDGDGKDDIAVFRPSNNVWYLLQSTLGFAAVQFGTDGDKPAPSAFRQ